MMPNRIRACFRKPLMVFAFPTKESSETVRMQYKDIHRITNSNLSCVYSYLQTFSAKLTPTVVYSSNSNHSSEQPI